MAVRYIKCKTKCNYSGSGNVRKTKIHFAPLQSGNKLFTSAWKMGSGKNQKSPLTKSSTIDIIVGVCDSMFTMA